MSESQQQNDGAAQQGQQDTPPISDASLVQLERICERLGASAQSAPFMARQLVKRAGQLARERDWSEAQALEYLLGLMLEASKGGSGPQAPL